jgi:hypothetical protein
MGATLRYVLLTAIRDRINAALLAAILLVCLASSFLGSAALAEGQAMSAVFAAASIRLLAVGGLVVFVCFHVRRLAESKELEAVLARPLSRERFILAYASGLWLIAILLIVPATLLLGLVFRPSVDGYLLWSASLLLEGLVMTTLALFAALTIETASGAVVACGGFYALSRMMSFFLDIARSKAAEAGDAKDLGVFLRFAMEGLSTLLPRLDLFGRTEWLVHGAVTATPWHVLLAQTAVYVPLLLLAAMFDLRRKRF